MDFKKFVIPWYMHMILIFIPMKCVCSEGNMLFYKKFRGCTYILDYKEFNPSAQKSKYDTEKLQKPAIDRQDEIYQVRGRTE